MLQRQVSLEDHHRRSLSSGGSRSTSTRRTLSVERKLKPEKLSAERRIKQAATKDSEEEDGHEIAASESEREKEDPWSEFRLQRFFRSHRASSRSPAALAAAIEEHERDVFVSQTQKLVVWHKLRRIADEERKDLQRSLDALCRLGEQEEEEDEADDNVEARRRHMFQVPQEEGLRGLNAAAFQLPAKLDQRAVDAMLRAFVNQRLPLHVSSFRRLIQLVKPILEKQPTVSFVPKGRRVTVVGDLHGKLRDLETIIHRCGWPRENNVLVFNGDFVDRGAHSVEVLSLLFALKVVWPDYVQLNRGNHEDLNIARANGFFAEVATKYGSSGLYLEICELFTLLPLCCVIEDAALVLHGGLPRDQTVTLSDINKIPRHTFSTTVTDMWWWEGTDDLDRLRRWRRSPRNVTIVEDLMWGDPHANLSDPSIKGTLLPNFSRGGGSSFGTECARLFLEREGLKGLIRSHQCVPEGYTTTDCGNGTRLYTVFSASGYDGTDNDGAVLRIPANRSRSPYPISYPAEDEEGLECQTKQYLVDQICEHKGVLRDNLKRMAWARDSRGLVSVEEWNAALQRTLNLHIDFRPLRLELEGNSAGLVDVEAFLARYSLEMLLPNGEGVRVAESELSAGALFANRRELSAVLRLLDSNHDGRLSREEMERGCQVLNQRLPPQKHVNGTLLFERLDVDGGGWVSVEELCEGWRVTHSSSAPDRPRAGILLPAPAAVNAFLSSSADALLRYFFSFFSSPRPA